MESDRIERKTNPLKTVINLVSIRDISGKKSLRNRKISDSNQPSKDQVLTLSSQVFRMNLLEELGGKTTPLVHEDPTAVRKLIEEARAPAPNLDLENFFQYSLFKNYNYEWIVRPLNAKEIVKTQLHYDSRQSLLKAGILIIGKADTNLLLFNYIYGRVTLCDTALEFLDPSLDDKDIAVFGETIADCVEACADEQWESLELYCHDLVNEYVH
jgi:hypothetical protein